MARSISLLSDRITHRRRVCLFLIFVAALSVWAILSGVPTMTPMERAIVGEWGRAEMDPRFSLTTARRPLTSPWVVQEFASDRSYRQWIVSAEDTGNSFVHVEGRWRIVDGVIRFEDQPTSVGRVARDAANWIASWTGLPVASPTSGVGRGRDVPFRLVDTNDLVLDFPNQDRHDWTRLPGSFRDRPRLSLVRAQVR